MHKKLFITLALITCVVMFFSTSCFAADGTMHDMGESAKNIAEDVKNGVSGAINNVEGTTRNTAEDISNSSKNVTGSMENTMSNAGNTVTEEMNNTSREMNDGMNNNTYSATRTSADGTTTFMGMGATAWTWLILGIAALAIIAAVWYYSMQTNSSKYNNRR